MIFIFYQVFIGLRKIYRKKKWLKKWNQHLKQMNGKETKKKSSSKYKVDERKNEKPDIFNSENQVNILLLKPSIENIPPELLPEVVENINALNKKEDYLLLKKVLLHEKKFQDDKFSMVDQIVKANKFSEIEFPSHFIDL